MSGAANSRAKPLRLLGRTAADLSIGLVLFATLAVAIAAYNHGRIHQYSLSGLLAVASSPGDLMKFSLDDSPKIAAALVATAIPVPQATVAPAGVPQAVIMGLFAGVVSLIVALNLAFLRHLRRTSAVPPAAAYRERVRLKAENISLPEGST